MSIYLVKLAVVLKKRSSTPLRSADLTTLAGSLRLLVRNQSLLPGGLVLGLDTHDTTAPTLPGILITLVELATAALGELGELGLVLGTDGGEGESGGGLLVNHGAQAGLALDNAVGHVHLIAQRRQPDDKLDRVDIVRDANKRRLLRLDELDNVVDAKLDIHRLLRRRGVLPGLLRLRHRGQALLLLPLALGLVLVQQLEERAGRGRVRRQPELVDRRRDLEALQQDLPLALQAHVLGPLDVTRQVHAARQHILADAKVLRSLLEQWVRHRLLDRLPRRQRRCGGRAALALLTGLRARKK